MRNYECLWQVSLDSEFESISGNMAASVVTMKTPYTVHTSTLFDPKKKAFVENVSVKVDPKTGLIVDVYQRTEADFPGGSVPEGDVDLRGKVVMPGLVDAHTHIFLHSYEYGH